MKSNNPSINRRYPLRRHIQHQHPWSCCVRALTVLVAGCIMMPAHADNDGRFDVISASYREEDGMWLADARIDLELSDQALDALRNSVALTIQYQFEVKQSRPFWPDKLVATRRMNIELRYLSLSERYIVRSLDTGEQETFATLYSALRRIGKISDYSIIATDEIDSEYDYSFFLRAVLNRDNLPGPLQVLAFWRGDYSLESKWYRWKLKQ